MLKKSNVKNLNINIKVFSISLQKGVKMTKIAKDEPFYQISQVSKLIGITSDRLRTYEEEGLVKPYRSGGIKSGKRLFSLEEIEWLEIIRELIKLGVTIPVIRILLTSKVDIKQNLLREKDKEIVDLIEKMYSHAIYNKL